MAAEFVPAARSGTKWLSRLKIKVDFTLGRKGQLLPRLTAENAGANLVCEHVN